MPIEVLLADAPKRGTLSPQDSSEEIVFIVTGTNIDAAMHAAVQTSIPFFVTQNYYGSIHTLTLQGYDYEYLGADKYRVVAKYSRRLPEGNDEGLGPQSEYSFDTTGGTVRVTHGKVISETTWTGGVVVPSNGGINITEDGVDGIDMIVPRFAWEETHYLPDTFVTPAYQITLRDLTGRVNDATWRGNAKGEVRFLGARGSKRGRDQWQITYAFEASPNATSIKIAEGTAYEITVPAKEGFHVLHVRTQPTVDPVAKTTVQIPVTAYVTQPAPDALFYGNFALLGI